MANETSTVNFVFTSTDKTKNILGGITKGFVALGAAATAAAGVAVAGLGAFAASGVKAAASMEEQMSNIAAVMGMTKDEIAPLGDLIEQLGLDPNLKVDATEAASAIELLARNGLDMQQILDGAARSTVLLANATGAEFGDAADIATDAMSIFGIEVANMEQAVDGIVGVTTNSKLSINDYALALANGGARAMAAGVSFEEFNATIALIADEAGNGQKAGTALGAMMTRLTPQTEKAKEAMQDLGIITAEGQNRFYDASGAFLGMGNAADVLRDTLGGLTDQQQLTAISTLFGVDASAAAIGIMNETSATVGAATSTINQQGQATDSAATRMDNLAGQWEIFMGIVDTVKLQIGNAFLPVLKNLVSAMSGLAEQHGPAIVTAFERIAEWIGQVLPPIMAKIPGWIQIAIDAFFRFRDWFNETKPIVLEFIQNALERLKSWWMAAQPIIQNLVAKFNTFKDWVLETIPIVKQFVSDALDRVETWFKNNKGNIQDFIDNTLKPLWDTIVDTATSIKDFVIAQYEKITAWYEENEPLIQNFLEVMRTVWAGAMTALVTFWQVVEPILDALISIILELATFVMAVVTGDWETAWQSIENIVVLAFEGIQGAFLGLANWVTSWFGTTWANVVETWKQNGRQFLRIGELIIQNIGYGIMNAYSFLRDSISNAAQRLKDGWTQGVQRVKRAIIEAALAPFRGAIDAVKRLLGIASPSKLFEELGMNTAQGFMIGMDNQAGNIAMSGAAMAGAAAQGAVQTVTNYNLNVATTANTSNVISDFNMMQAWAGA